MRLSVRLALVVLVLSQVECLLAWTTPERVDRRPPGYVTNCPAIAVEPGGIVHATWTETQASHYWDKIMYARRDGDTWPVPMNISRDSGDIRTPAIALEGNGNRIVVWSEASYSEMRYVHFLGDTWSLPKFCFSNNGITPRLATDSRGRVHLLFEEYTGHGGIWYSYYMAEADSWATPIAVASSGQPLGWSDLVVDRFDHLHAVWMDWGTYGISYSHNDGSGWAAPMPLPDPAPGEYSCQPRITVDAAARPHVVWQERSGGYWLYYSSRDADSWTSPRRLSPQSSGPPVTCSDSFGRVYVVYGWYDGLRCIVRTDTAWSAPERISDTVALQEIAADGGLVHAVWREQWCVYYSSRGAPGAREATGTDTLSIGLRVTTSSGRPQACFSLKAGSRVVLSLFDVAGRCTLERNLGVLGAGIHSVELRLDSVPPGLYFGLLRTNAGNKVAKFAIMG